jgi:hypothetical protein
MNTPSLPSDLFFELLKQLAMAHGLPSPESADDVRELAFTPGGAHYRLMPHPLDDSQALLEIDCTPLEPHLENTSQAPALEQLLRSCLQINAELQEETDWLISLDDEDRLVLSASVPLMTTSAEALQMLALDGLQRAHALRDFF